MSRLADTPNATLIRHYFRLLEIGEGEQISGSQLGSQRRQTSRDVLRRPEIVFAAR
jgi:hypothetical protein